MFQPQSSVKNKPVAMVAASARISEASCHPRIWGEDSWNDPKNNQVKHQKECPDISPFYSNTPHILRRNSLTCLPVRRSVEEDVDENARTLTNTHITTNEETNLQRNLSGGSAPPNSTLERRNRINNPTFKIPEADKTASFHKHTSLVYSPSGTLERSRSRYSTK